MYKYKWISIWDLIRYSYSLVLAINTPSHNEPPPIIIPPPLYQKDDLNQLIMLRYIHAEILTNGILRKVRKKTLAKV